MVSSRIECVYCEYKGVGIDDMAYHYLLDHEHEWSTARENGVLASIRYRVEQLRPKSRFQKFLDRFDDQAGY